MSAASRQAQIAKANALCKPSWNGTCDHVREEVAIADRSGAVNAVALLRRLAEA